MKSLAVAAALLAATITTPVLAQGTEGLYIALDLGSVSFNNSNLGGTEFAGPKSFRIASGYRFTPTVAVEAAYVNIGSSTMVTSVGNVTLKNSVLQLAAVANYPLNDSFDLIGKLGISSDANKVSGTGNFSGLNTSNRKTSLMYGVGAQYNVNKQWAVRAQYEDFGKHTISDNLSNASWSASMTQLSVGAVCALQ
ncbi:MAG: porin family protein [Gallionella sp.]|jgi:OOP family OmpA-OmpF porin